MSEHYYTIEIIDTPPNIIEVQASDPNIIQFDKSEPKYSYDILNFDDAVSQLITVKNINAGSGIGIVNNSGIYTVAVTGTFGLTGEEVDDRVSQLLIGVSGINLNYNDNTNSLIISTTGLQPSGNYANANHFHLSSDINNFDSTVSGLLPVKNINSGSGISVTNNSGDFTVSVTGQFGLTSEQVDDRISNLLIAGSYVNLNYNDSLDSLTINVSGLQPSGNYSITGHTHTSSEITDFNNSVNGLVSGVYAPLNSPSFSGVPTVPTASSGTNTNQIASTSFVRNEISNLVNSAPSTLDTLNELASALGNDSNFATTVASGLANKAPLVHSHTIVDVSGLQTVLDNKQPSGVYASGIHAHVVADITNFASGVSGLLPTITGSGYVNSIFTNNTYSISVSGLQPSGHYADSVHASSHLPSGVDQLFDQSLNTADSPTFAGLTLTGASVGISYNDLDNLPTLFDGDYNSLSNLPTLFDGDYNSLSSLPTLFDGDYNNLSNLPTLFDGDYNNLSNLPTLFDGDYNSLSNQPDLSGYLAANLQSPTEGQILTYTLGEWTNTDPNVAFVDDYESLPGFPSRNTIYVTHDSRRAWVANFDLSPNDHAITGNAKISTTQSKFGGSSVMFSGGFLSIPYDESLDLQSEDWTVEFWWKPSAQTVATLILLSVNSDANYGGQLQIQAYPNTHNFRCLVNNGDGWVNTDQIGEYVEGEWHHIAAVRQNNDVYFFVNGVLELTFAVDGSVGEFSGPTIIGNDLSKAFPLISHIDDIRIIKGTALYASGFAPPTSPLIAVSGTSLLINGETVWRELTPASHTHASSDISDFNSSVSGLLPVKDIIAGSGISVGSEAGIYTITADGAASASASSLVTNCSNRTGSVIPKMTVVYINGGHGNLPTITPAQANNEANSSKTYGITQTQISDNGTGNVVVFGALIDVDTNQFGASEGSTLYLSPTVAGGITATKPSAPDHMVSVGKIIRNHNNQGIIEVVIQNGFELQELHNVAISGVNNGEFLQYNSASGLWVPSSSGNFSSLFVNGTGVSLTGHSHNSSDITNFNSSVSGLLPVTNIVGGSNVSVSSSGSIYTVAVTGSLGLTTEEVDDRVSNLLVAGSGINLNYNDNANTLTISTINNIILSDVVDSTNYIGRAVAGTSTSSSSWRIKRTIYNSAGSVTSSTVANNVAWNDRLTASYS